MVQDNNILEPIRSNFGRETLISVVVPLYNEEEVLHEFHRRVHNVLNSMPLAWEIVYVNDGSTDHSFSILCDLKRENPSVAIIDLSRNFGKEIALSAGIDHAKGDAVIVIDADLQDPPEVIPEFIAKWKAGYDVVYGQRISRDGETKTKKITAYAFYRIMQHVSRVKIPPDTGDFRLLSRRAVEALKKLREQHRFMKGLFTWIGYRQIAVPYKRASRPAGQTKWNYWKLWNLAVEGITSFTIFPLKIASYLGIFTAFGAFLYLVFIIYKTLIYGDPVAGYPSLMVVMLFLGGVQLLTLGVIGEYVGRIFNETKYRPLYLVDRYIPSELDTATGQSLRG